jgi:hypothetical protein
MQVSLGQYWYLPVAPHPRGLLLGGQLLANGDTVAGLAGAALSVATLRVAAREHAVTIRGMAHPPLAALVAFVTGDPTALHPCFPLTRTLDPAGLAAFDALVAAVARSPELDLRCFDERWGGVREVPVPADAALLVAGHLAELFFVRRDLLETLLAARPRIWLYTTPRAFERGGGVAGGCYSPAEGAIKLLHARLWEGYTSPMPGVAPFLHELGHMLDCLDVAHGVLGPATGLYPGLRPADGAVYTAEARRLFAEGKALEIQRYRRRVVGERDAEAPLGHPYVFQSDGEFLAGYLELFLRCPNAFAAQDPALYASFVTLFGQDPRRAWVEDFPFYVQANREYYASGACPPPDGLTNVSVDRKT